MKKTIQFKISQGYYKTILFFSFVLLSIWQIQAQTLVMSLSTDQAVCQGTTVSITATITAHGSYRCPTHGPSSYIYAWKINGADYTLIQNSATSSTITLNSLPPGSNGIACYVTERFTCDTTINVGGGGSFSYSYGSFTIDYENGLGLYVFPNHPNLHILPNPAPGPYVTNNEYSFSIPSTLVPNLSYTWSVDPRFGTIKSSNGDNTSIVVHTANATTPTPADPADPIQIMVTSTNVFCSKSDNINVASINTPPLQPSVPSVVSFGEDNSVVLSWNVSSSDNNLTVANGDNTAVKYYIINYTDVPAGTTGSYTYTVAPSDQAKKTLTVTVPNLLEQTKTNHHAYTFSVIAQDDYGLNSSASQTSSPAYIIDHTAPDVPTMVTFIEQTDNTVTLTWNASSDNVATTGYNIYRNTVKVATVGAVNVYTAALGTLPANFTVDAFDANNYKSGMSNPGIDVTHQVDPFVIDPATGFVGIGVNPPSEKLDVDGNLKVRGDIIMDKFDKTKPDVITFTGTSLDIYTPSQAQYNGHQPIISMTQWGEIKFNSTPYLNYNDIKFLETGNYINGIGYRDAFGGVTNIGGPVLFGEKGGALGSKQGSWNGPEQTALKWDQQSNVSVTGALYMPALSQGTRPVEDPWITQGFTSNNPLYPSYQSELTLRQYWKTKVTANTPQFFVTGEINAVGGYRVAGRDIHSGNPDVVNNAPYYGIGMSNKILSGTIAAVQVAGYGGIILTDNTGVAVSVHDGNTQVKGNLDFIGNLSHNGSPVALITMVNNYNTIQGNANVTGTFKVGTASLIINGYNGVPQTGTPNINEIYSNAVIEPLYINKTNGANTIINPTAGIVSIGTTDPGTSYLLDVKLNIAGSLVVSSGIALGSLSQNSAYGQSFITTSPVNDILFYAGNNEVISLGSDGNTSVSQSLNVAGNVVIGNATSHSSELDVYGNARIVGTLAAKHIVVNTNATIPDYVFIKGYDLPSLSEIEAFVTKNHHLPGVANAKDIAENGMNLEEMNIALLKQVEILTLHLIKQEKEIAAMKKKFKNKE